MIEIQFIPLKSQNGLVVGHARVQDGFVDVHLRKSGGGQALVLTEDGYAQGLAEARIRAGGRVTAVAVHLEKQLTCVGFARGSMLSLADVRRRIDALTAKPAPPDAKPAPTVAAANLKPEGGTAARMPDVPERKDGHAEGDGAEMLRLLRAAKAAPERAPARRSARHVPADDSVLQTLAELSKPDGAGFLAPEPAAPSAEKNIVAAFHDDEDEARSEAFAALLARADAVFRRISLPFEDEDAPMPPVAELEPRAQEPEKAARAEFSPRETDAPEAATAAPSAPEAAMPLRGNDTWSRAVDEMLSAAPAHTECAIENPFPHIFPDAQFVRREGLYESETLTGEWERNGEKFAITAVLGDYSPQPPENLAGFTRYIRTLQGGFWVRVEDGHFSFAKEK